MRFTWCSALRLRRWDSNRAPTPHTHASKRAARTPLTRRVAARPPTCLGFRGWGWGLGFGVWDLGFGVWGFWFRVSGLGFRVKGLRSRF